MGKRRGEEEKGEEEGLTVISNMDIEFPIHYSLGSSVQLVMHPFDVANQKILNILSHNIVVQAKKTDDIHELACSRLLFQAGRVVKD